MFFLTSLIPFLAVDQHLVTAWCRRRWSTAVRWRHRWSWWLWSSWCLDSNCTSDKLRCCTGMVPGNKQSHTSPHQSVKGGTSLLRLYEREHWGCSEDSWWTMKLCLSLSCHPFVNTNVLSITIIIKAARRDERALAVHVRGVLRRCIQGKTPGAPYGGEVRPIPSAPDWQGCQKTG